MEQGGQARAPVIPAARVHRGYREHSRRGKRTRRGAVYFDDLEWALVVQAAALENKKPMAWLSQVAGDAAASRLRGVPTDRAVLTTLAGEVRALRTALARIGGNLNAVAAHANSTGEVASIGAEAQSVLRLVRRMVNRSEEQLVAVARVLP